MAAGDGGPGRAVRSAGRHPAQRRRQRSAERSAPPARRWRGGSSASSPPPPRSSSRFFATPSPTPSERLRPATRSRSPRHAAGRWLRCATGPSTSPSTPRRRGEVERGPRLAADPRLPPGDALHAPRRRRDHARSTQLERGEITAEDAVTGVRKDLLDAYQARLVTYLDEAEQADRARLRLGASPRTPRSPPGYWRSIALPSTRSSAAPARRKQRGRRLRRARRGGRRGDSPRLPRGARAGPRRPWTASPPPPSPPRSRSAGPTS